MPNPTSCRLVVCLAAVGLAAPAIAQPVALNYNFNGMVHSGELGALPNPGVANNPTGYRSISDRGLLINGAAGSFGTGAILGGTGLSYTIVTTAGVPDLVMLGDRNRFGTSYTLGNGNNFDNVADADTLGTMPTWLPNGGTSITDSNFTAPQVTTLGTPATLTSVSQIGILYHITNDGGRFDVTLRFTDATSVTATLAGPDWFGSQTAPAALAGVASQAQMGVYNGVAERDNPRAGGSLNIYEGVITAARLLADLGFDVNGKQLQSIEFGNRQNTFGTPLASTVGPPSFAIYAATIGGAIAPPANDFCSNATNVGEGVFNGTSAGATGIFNSSCGVADSSDVWYRYTPTASGTARFSLCSSGFDTTLAVYSGTCGALSELGCNDNFCDLASRVEVAVVSGQPVYVRIAGNAGATGLFTLQISNPVGVQAGPFTRPEDGHVYYLLYPSGWNDAQATAVALGGNLATIEDATENEWVRTNVLNYDGGTIFRRGWIGLNDVDVEGTFVWASGSTATYRNFAAGEPNNAGGLEDWTEVNHETGVWNDARESPGASNYGIVEIVPPRVNPAGSGSANPTPVEQGQATELRVNVLPAELPPSTGISVTVDLASFSLGTMTPMTDAGGGLWTYNLAIPLTQPAQTYNIPFRIMDAELRTFDGVITFRVVGPTWDELTNGGSDAGDIPATALAVTGGAGQIGAITGSLTGLEADMFLINVCDIANFDANAAPGTTFDTQLWLFNVDGTGVMFNDDTTGLVSRLTNAGGQITAPGNYYLAISTYDWDALDINGAALWIDTPFAGVRAPDGPGAANPVVSWSGTGASPGGNYRIAVAGVCYAVQGPVACNAADIATAGNPDPQAGPDNFLTGDDFDLFINAFFNELRRTSDNSLIADLVDGDGNPPRDNFLTGTDFDYFLAKFFQGC